MGWRARGRSRRSATIIEIAMAIVILGVGMPPLLVAFAEGSMKSIGPSNATIASFLATERMEQIVARRYASNTGYANVVAANFPNETPVSGFTGFTRTVTISEVTSSLATSGTAVGYRKVRVRVTWNSGTKQVFVERIFASF